VGIGTTFEDFLLKLLWLINLIIAFTKNSICYRRQLKGFLDGNFIVSKEFIMIVQQLFNQFNFGLLPVTLMEKRDVGSLCGVKYPYA
jgi:hypothetical protein